MFNQLLIYNASYLWNQNAERSSDDQVRAQGDRRRGIGIGCYGFDPVERQRYHYLRLSKSKSSKPVGLDE